jgi:hypothetical protein
MWKIWRAPNNASKWQMGFNSAFKGLMARMLYFSSIGLLHTMVIGFETWYRRLSKGNS